MVLHPLLLFLLSFAWRSFVRASVVHAGAGAKTNGDRPVPAPKTAETNGDPPAPSPARKLYGFYVPGVGGCGPSACIVEGRPPAPTRGSNSFNRPSPTRRPPTRRPTRSPTRRPTRSPTRRPTPLPSFWSFAINEEFSMSMDMPDVPDQRDDGPGVIPTRRPTPWPTRRPTQSPTRRPTPRPTRRPTSRPTASPSRLPSDVPSISPSDSTAPTQVPTSLPSGLPSLAPTESSSPTMVPSESVSPTNAPSSVAESALVQKSGSHPKKVTSPFCVVVVVVVSLLITGHA